VDDELLAQSADLPFGASGQRVLCGMAEADGPWNSVEDAGVSAQIARKDEPARRLVRLTGAGEPTAIALAAMVNSSIVHQPSAIGTWPGARRHPSPAVGLPHSGPW
jgi:hypothetical protein